MYVSEYVNAISTISSTGRTKLFSLCLYDYITEGVKTLTAGGSQGSADGQGTVAQFNDPKQLAVSTSGLIYVGDYGNCMIRVCTTSGIVSTLSGSTSCTYVDGPITSARFNGPYGLTVDSLGILYVADGGNHAVRMVSGGLHTSFRCS
jgi:hypothetical protein